jgi:hypothetical protein
MHIFRYSYLIYILIITGLRQGRFTGNYMLYMTDVDGSNYRVLAILLHTLSLHQGHALISRCNVIYGMYLVYYVDKSVQRHDHHT